MTTTDLVPIQPKEVVADGRGMAQALMDILKSKTKPIVFQGEQYLEYEDWLLLARFFRYTVMTGEPTPIDIDGVKGFSAKAWLRNEDGAIVGGAEAYCMRDEPNWKNKPTFQLASMAQTRAGAKACRNVFAWVAVMAGARPTPAEEMDGVVPKEDIGKYAKTKGPEHVEVPLDENAIPYSYVQAKWQSLLGWNDEAGKVDLAKWAEAHGITVRSWKPIMPSLQKQYLAHLNDLYDQLTQDSHDDKGV